MNPAREVKTEKFLEEGKTPAFNNLSITRKEAFENVQETEELGRAWIYSDELKIICSNTYKTFNKKHL